MTKLHPGIKVAVLLASGFCQDDFIQTQRFLQESGVTVKTVSPENGIMNGWADMTWGHTFAVDEDLNTSLGADYSVLIIPGGERGIDKLMMTAHTKRFVKSFMTAQKPIVTFNEGLRVLAETDGLDGRKVSCCPSVLDVVKDAGADCCEDDICVDGHLMSGIVTAENRLPFITNIIDFIAEQESGAQEAA